MRASTTFSEMQAAATVSWGCGGCLRGALPQYRQQMPWLSDGHLQRRRKQHLLELRRRTCSCMANVPREPKWMHGRRKRRRRRAGFGKHGVSYVSQPLQGHGLYPSSAEPPAMGPSGGGCGVPIIRFSSYCLETSYWLENKVQPRARSSSPYCASHAVSHLGDDHGIKLI